MHRVGDRFGPYALESFLGQGISGQVWKARDVNLSRTVALKLLSLDEPDDVRLFLREARTAAALDHPNIAAVYDIGEAAGFHYIAMQFIDGAPPRGPLRPREAARIVRDAALAVAFAHDRKIVHRDLKPANLIVSRDRVYVMDFGLARSTKHAASLTASGVLVGSPAFMSPEQARGERATPASDVWCLGTTLYNLLSGRHPFEGPSLVALLTAVTETDPRPLEPDVSRELCAIVTACLEKDPSRRHRSARDLAADLDRFLSGQHVTTRGSGSLQRIARPLARHRLALAAGSGALAMVVVLLAVLLPQIARTESTARHRAAMRRLEDAILETRAFLYIRDTDIRARLSGVEAAVAELERVEPKDADVWSTLGAGRYVTGDPAAEPSLRKAIALRADHPAARLLLGRLCLERALAARLGSPAQREETSVWIARAAEHLSRVPDAQADPVAAQVLRAWRAYVAKSDFAAACDEGLRRFGSAPGTEDFHLLLCFTDSEPDAVERRVALALDVRPHFPLARLVRALVRINTDHAQDALADIDEAIRLHPRLAQAHALRGDALLRTGDRVRAAAAFREALRLDPEDDASWRDLGLSLGAGDAKNAFAALDEAIRLRPDSAIAHVARGSVHLDRGELDAARADFERAVALQDRLASAHAGLGRVHAQRGDAAAAERCYAEAMRHDPLDPVVRANAGALLFATGRLADALALFDDALRLQPSSAMALANRGRTREKLGEHARAMADYDAAIAVEPHHYEALSYRANLRRSSGDVPGALADLDRAIAAEPGRLEAYTVRAVIRLKAGDREGAAADVRRLLEIAPADWPRRATWEETLRDLER